MSDPARAIAELIPSVGSLVEFSPVGGGCISEAARATVRSDSGDSQSLLVKSNTPSFLENFQTEWDGLSRLRSADAIRVPEPIAVGVADGRAWLILEWIDQGSRGREFFPDFGAALADLHRVTLGAEIGLDRDNFLGSARQINTPGENWVEFVASHRIGFQIRWAVDQGLADGGLKRDCDQILATMDRLLEGRQDETSLLHGDLWSGNYLCDRDHKPVLIDPAVYYGCREAEFGMLKLFGSCPSSFYEGYLDQFPLPAGWQRRTSVYVLYHLLNHLNLFGGGYLGQCRSVAAEILRG